MDLIGGGRWEARDEKYELIYSVVASIPSGRVATYAQVARVAGLPGRARLVGHALRVLPEGRALPWHRVINAGGGISPRGAPDCEHDQRLLLKAEGVVFDGRGRVPLGRFQWEPGSERDEW